MKMVLTDKEYKDKGFVKLQGKWYATLKVLLNEAHIKFKDKLSIKTKLLEHDMENKSAVFVAQVVIGDNVFTGYGDSNKLNTGAMVQPSYVRMAETRAIVRALRFATNIAETSKEELND